MIQLIELFGVVNARHVLDELNNLVGTALLVKFTRY